MSNSAGPWSTIYFQSVSSRQRPSGSNALPFHCTSLKHTYCTTAYVLYYSIRTVLQHTYCTTAYILYYSISHSLPLHYVVEDKVALSPTAGQQHPVVGGEAEPRGSTSVRSWEVGHLALRLTAPEADTPIRVAGGYHPSLVRREHQVADGLRG